MMTGLADFTSYALPALALFYNFHEGGGLRKTDNPDYRYDRNPNGFRVSATLTIKPKVATAAIR